MCWKGLEKDNRAASDIMRCVTLRLKNSVFVSCLNGRQQEFLSCRVLPPASPLLLCGFCCFSLTHLENALHLIHVTHNKRTEMTASPPTFGFDPLYSGCFPVILTGKTDLSNTSSKTPLSKHIIFRVFSSSPTYTGNHCDVLCCFVPRKKVYSSQKLWETIKQWDLARQMWEWNPASCTKVIHSQKTEREKNA